MEGKTIAGLLVGILVIGAIIILLIWLFTPSSTGNSPMTPANTIHPTSSVPFASWFSSTSSEPVAARGAPEDETDVLLGSLDKLTYDNVAQSRAIFFTDSMSGDPWASPPFVPTGGNSVSYSEASTATLSTESAILPVPTDLEEFPWIVDDDNWTTLPVDDQIRRGWSSQYRIIAQIIFLMRLRQRISVEQRRLLRRLIWLLFNDQRRFAVILARRHGDDFGRRYFGLQGRFLRLLLWALLRRARNEEQRLHRTRQEIELVIAELDGFMGRAGSQGWRPMLLDLTNRVWIQESFSESVMYRGLDDLPVPPQVEQLIHLTARAISSNAEVPFTPASTAARGAEAPFTPMGDLISDL